MMDANIKTDTKQFATDADTLIANFFSTKKIKLKDVPKEMHGELSFKRSQLIKKLDSMSNRRLNNNKTNELKATKFIIKIFDEFVKRIKYIQITDWNNRLIQAINEKKGQSATSTNCSYPEIDTNKRFLLARSPE